MPGISLAEWQDLISLNNAEIYHVIDYLHQNRGTPSYFTWWFDKQKFCLIKLCVLENAISRGNRFNPIAIVSNQMLTEYLDQLGRMRAVPIQDDLFVTDANENTIECGTQMSRQRAELQKGLSMTDFFKFLPNRELQQAIFEQSEEEHDPEREKITAFCQKP